MILISFAGPRAAGTSGWAGREAPEAISGKQEPCCDEVRPHGVEDYHDREQQGMEGELEGNVMHVKQVLLAR